VARRISTADRFARTDAATAHEPDFDWSWTEEGPAWVAPAVDTRRPSIARIYDYVLGGKDHHAIDRETADRLAEIVPDVADVARANRAFVLRAVTDMAEAGIRQFLDLGCGLPGSPAVHEVARQVLPDARVVYVDLDPVVVAHARAVLDGQPGLYAVHHDLRDPSRVLRDRGLQTVLSSSEPTGLILGSVLHFVDLAIGPQVVGHYVHRMATGSRVAFSVGTRDGVNDMVAREVEQVLRAAHAPIALRTLAQVEELVDGLQLLDPGITDVTCWRNDGVPGALRLHAGVGIKI
jgi:SAM-dependent methyltransferase